MILPKRIEVLPLRAALRRLLRPTGHSSRRWNAILKTVCVSGIGRGVSLVCMFAQVPIALRYLGADAFGLWMAITSTVVFFGFADLGIGLGLQNCISQSFGNEDFERAAVQYRSAVALLSAIGMFVFLVAIAVTSVVDCAKLFKISDQRLLPECRTAVLLVTAVFCLNLPLAAAQRLAAGLQLGWLVSLSLITSNVVSLFSVAAGARFGATFPLFICLPLLAQSFGNIFLWQILRKRLVWLRRRGARINAPAAMEILQKGVMFTVPQLASAFLLSAAPIFIATRLGATQVTNYNLLLRVASVPNQMMAMLSIPLWPAYAEAAVRGDASWISRTFKLSITAALVAALVSGLVFALGCNELLAAWLRSTAFTASWDLRVAAGCYCGVLCLTPAISSLLNGTDKLKGQAVIGVGTSLVILVSMPSLTTRFGLTGTMLSQVIAYSAFNLPASIYLCRALFKPNAVASVRP